MPRPRVRSVRLDLHLIARDLAQAAPLNQDNRHLHSRCSVHQVDLVALLPLRRVDLGVLLHLSVEASDSVVVHPPRVLSVHLVPSPVVQVHSEALPGLYHLLVGP